MLERPVRIVFLLLFAMGCAAAPPDAIDGREAPRLRSGPMRGYAQLTEVALWLQTTAPATVRVRYWPAGRETEARTSQPVETTESRHLAALVRLAGLTHGTHYEYEVLLGGQSPLRQTEWTFLTQTLWQSRNPPPDFTVAVGSCYYANDPASDPPRSQPYAGSPAIFERIADKRPDLMLWLGDNVYYREPDFGSAAALRERNALAREEPALRRLLATTSHYAIWDDHDFGPNNVTWTYPLAPAADEAFRLYWANPTYGLPDVRGIFGLFSWADVDFFLLDGRTYRTPETAVPAESRRMLGDGQMRWLKDARCWRAKPRSR